MKSSKKPGIIRSLISKVKWKVIKAALDIGKGREKGEEKSEKHRSSSRLLSPSREDMLFVEKKLSTLQQIALFLVLFPPEISANIFKEFGPEEVQKISLAISKLPHIEPKIRNTVLYQYIEKLRRIGVKIEYHNSPLMYSVKDFCKTAEFLKDLLRAGDTARIKAAFLVKKPECGGGAIFKSPSNSVPHRWPDISDKSPPGPGKSSAASRAEVQKSKPSNCPRTPLKRMQNEISEVERQRRALRLIGAIPFICIIAAYIALTISPLPAFTFDVALSINLLSALLLILFARYANKSDTKAPGTIELFMILLRFALFIYSTRMMLQAEYAPGGETAGTIITALGHAMTEGSHYLEGLFVLVILILLHFHIMYAMKRESDKIRESLGREDRKEERGFFDLINKLSALGLREACVYVISIALIPIFAFCSPGSLAGSFSNFAKLFLGYGILTILPAFLSFIAIEMLFSRQVKRGCPLQQHPFQSRGFYCAASGMLILGFLKMAEIKITPGIPYFLIAELLMITGKYVGDTGSQEEKKTGAGESGTVKDASSTPLPPVTPEPEKPESVVKLLEVDPISMQVGRDLLEIVIPVQSARLFERVTAIRRHLALEYGIVLPGMRFMDNLMLQPDSYVIKIRGLEAGRGKVSVDRIFATASEELLRSLRGDPGVHPSYGLPGKWIEMEDREKAEKLGCCLFDPVSFIGAHITEVCKGNLPRLIGNQETQALLDNIKRTHPAVLRDLVPEMFYIGEIRQVLRNLLDEMVSIRDLVTILETLGDNVGYTKDQQVLTELVRRALAAQIASAYRNDDGTIRVMTLDSEYETILTESLHKNEMGEYLSLDPELGVELLISLEKQAEKFFEEGSHPVILCAPGIRPHLRKLVAGSIPKLAVLSRDEIVPGTHIDVAAVISPGVDYEDDEIL